MWLLFLSLRPQVIREQLGKVQFKTTEVLAAAQLQRDSRAGRLMLPCVVDYSCIKAGRVGVMGVVLKTVDFCFHTKLALVK